MSIQVNRERIRIICIKTFKVSHINIVCQPCKICEAFRYDHLSDKLFMDVHIGNNWWITLSKKELEEYFMVFK